MSWMSEINIICQEALAFGERLVLEDFSTVDNQLRIRGVDSDAWFAERGAIDTY